jgi:hypothetical protein
MELNIELMEKTLEHIEKHPEEWAQEAFRCDTGMCFAGHAAFLSGRVVNWQTPEDTNDDWVITGDGKAAPVDVVAEKALGIARIATADGIPIAECLFDGGNTLDDLRRYVSELKETGTIARYLTAVKTD